MWFSSQRENHFYILHGSKGAAPTKRIPLRGGELNFKGCFLEAFVLGVWKLKSWCPEVVPCRKKVQVSLRLISLLQAVKNPFSKPPEKVGGENKQTNTTKPYFNLLCSSTIGRAKQATELSTWPREGSERGAF